MCYLGVFLVFVVDFFVGDPFVYICKFSFCKSSFVFMCCLLMYVCKVRTSEVCFPIAIPLSQYGMVCVVCMWCWCGFGVGGSLVKQLINILLSIILVWVL